MAKGLSASQEWGGPGGLNSSTVSNCLGSLLSFCPCISYTLDKCTLFHKLMFIWPCKSDCQPIFTKMQHSNSISTKLWFVRPLIFQFRDFSPWFLLNVTFGKSFAFQMRDKYIFETNSFENWTSRRLTISHAIWAKNRTQTKKFGNNYFNNVVLDFCQNGILKKIALSSF